MSTLRGRANRFTRIGQMSNELIQLKVKSKSRLKSYTTKTPVLGVGDSTVICADLGSLVLIRDVLSSDFGVELEFHSTAACLDEDPLLFSLDPSDRTVGSLIRIMDIHSKSNPIVQNGDTLESPTIYIKVINSAFSQKSFILRFNYFDISETVYDKIYPTFKISSNLVPLVVPLIRTPIDGFEISRIQNEYSVDTIPRLVDSTQYVGYNQQDYTTQHQTSGLLVAPSAVINNKLIKKLKFSPGFQLEGLYRIYFQVLKLDDPSYTLIQKFNPDISDLPGSIDVELVFTDQKSKYVTKLTVNTSPENLGKLGPKMIVLTISNGQIQNNPVVADSDLI